jgi:hypothetical protein
MKGDFTRSTFNKEKHYSGVRMQQGRVQLDADWNEQLDIERHHATTEATDVIGACGAPKGRPGFGVVVDPATLGSDEQEYLDNNLKLTPLVVGDFLLTPGRFYAGGTLCENEDFVAFTGQPDLRGVQPITDAGTYLVYLDVWQRHLTALDDEAIREQALGGPDSATRTKTVWQVKTLKFDQASTPHCVTGPKEWQSLLGSSTVKLMARAKPGEESKNLCALPPGAGYRRLENQLYRVEIHKPGGLGAATFKFSRENGSVVTAIKNINGKEIEVADLGRDQALGFANDDWVELLDDDTELKGPPGELAQIDHVDPVRRVITLKTPPGLVNLQRHPKLRRWESRDGKAEFTVEFNPAVNDGWIALEDGVEIQFIPGVSNTSDFWVVPARTASNDVEWPVKRDADGRSTPVAQPPLGIAHDYCCLAIVERFNAPDKLELKKDCRDIFPPLTHVCAEDVCFNNEHCKLPGAETVQDAIEALCQEDLDTDLKTHNKYLHGSGVVCGLKLRCHEENAIQGLKEDRRKVLVEPGYALDCKGNSIHVRDPLPYEIVTAATDKGLLHDGDGEVCVRIERGVEQETKFSVEAVVPQKFWDSVLEGTLPKDFYKDCIESLLTFLKSRFLPIPDDTVPVSVKQKRVISVLNLLIQLLNSASGPYVFLSTAEHDILLDFYKELKLLLASETFCAMFDDDRKFPEYPFKAPGIETAFGLFKFHRRLRLHPSGNYAYTCGGGPTIQAYDLKTRALKELLIFPGGSNVEVQDVAFSQDGSEMYVVALNNQSSAFATVTIGANQSHSWGPTAVICGFKFVSLATSPSSPKQLLAIAKAKGLYSFNPAGMPLTPGPSNEVKPFNATGIFAVSDDGKWGFAAVNPGIPLGTEAPKYTEVQRIDLAKPDNQVIKYRVGGLDAENDIAHQTGVNDGTIHITGDPGAGLVKPLHSFDAKSALEVNLPIDLQNNTATRLAILPGMNQLLVALSDRYKLLRVNLANRQLVPNFRVPVQIMPIGLSIRSKNEVVVLNYLSNTLSVVDIAKVISAPPVFPAEPPTELSNYRQQILDAYADLLGHLLQHLKDCFCDHYLVDCPDCDTDTKVYLGCVEIREDKVFNICNLSKRHYVKTFNNYGYWLSTIPVLPLVKEAIARFCCRVL